MSEGEIRERYFRFPLIRRYGLGILTPVYARLDEKKSPIEKKVAGTSVAVDNYFGSEPLPKTHS